MDSMITLRRDSLPPGPLLQQWLCGVTRRVFLSVHPSSNIQCARSHIIRVVSIITTLLYASAVLFALTKHWLPTCDRYDYNGDTSQHFTLLPRTAVRVVNTSTPKRRICHTCFDPISVHSARVGNPPHAAAIFYLLDLWSRCHR